MKSNPRFCRFILGALVASALALSPTITRATATEAWAGGENGNPTIWDNGLSSDWSGGVWVNSSNANFSDAAASNTITVDSVDTSFNGPLIFNQMSFSKPGNWLIQAQADQPGSTPYDFSTDNYLTLVSSAGDYANGNPIISMTAGAGPVTISAPIEIGDMGYNANEQGVIINASSSTLTLGSIDFGAYQVNNSTSGALNTRQPRLEFSGNNTGGAIVFNGTYTSANPNGGSIILGFNNTGTYTFASTADFSTLNLGKSRVGLNAEANSFVMNGSVLNIATSKFEAAQTLALNSAPSNSVVNIVGAQNIGLNIYDSMKNSGTRASDGVNPNGQATFIQSTADVSTWSSSIFTLDGTSVVLGAVAGGRLNVNANMSGNAPLGIVKTGLGTVVLSSAAGNSYDERDGNGHLQTFSTLAADLQAGTTLITNTSGSAFGNASNGDATYNNAGVHQNVVNLEAGATLGGSGISTRAINAVGATSVLAAGDSGSDGGTKSMATLHLTGGVTAASGLTMDFKLASTPAAASDKLDLGAGAFTLSGVVDVNLTAFDGPLTAGTYTLATGTGTWTDAGATFVFTAPVGDSVTSFSFIEGSNDSFTVTLAAPEPSTYALIGIALLVLIGSGKLRKQGV